MKNYKEMMKAVESQNQWNVNELRPFVEMQEKAKELSREINSGNYTDDEKMKLNFILALRFNQIAKWYKKAII